jgi:hypothetical protein
MVTCEPAVRQNLWVHLYNACGEFLKVTAREPARIMIPIWRKAEFYQDAGDALGLRFLIFDRPHVEGIPVEFSRGSNVIELCGK